MKPLKLSILVTIIVITNNIAFSQTNKYDEAPKSPSFYFGLGTGINVNTGLTGIKCCQLISPVSGSSCN